MLFNSYHFVLVFLPITFGVYFILIQFKQIVAAKLFMVAASLFFYGYWNPIYLILIIVSMLVNYSVGIALVHQFKFHLPRRAVIIFGVIFNLGLLGYYKYTDFFIENLNTVFGTSLPLPHIILPLGISFFTFTQIAFLVDAYKNEAKEYSLVNYLLFVSYFPHLLAGPILHHKEMMPQFNEAKNFKLNYDNIAVGLYVFSIGLFKKVMIADTFAVWANRGFDATSLNLLEAWAASLSYTIQLYFDFSGYTDMAIGISLFFNIYLPINFNSPYKAANIQDFWRRWHITLSRFLRDYLYIPLGGNRVSKSRMYLNLFITFLLGGFWHGAGWTFLIWGALHGGALVLHRMWQNLGFKLNKILAVFITFNFVNIAWVFFRAKDFDSASKMIKSMFDVSNLVLPYFLEAHLRFLSDFGMQFGKWISTIEESGFTKIAPPFIAILLLIFLLKNSMELMQRFKMTYRSAIIAGFLFMMSMYNMYEVTEFLYFNF